MGLKYLPQRSRGLMARPCHLKKSVSALFEMFLALVKVVSLVCVHKKKKTLGFLLMMEMS